MAISRRDFMKVAMEGINNAFEEAYEEFGFSDWNRIEMPRRGRYQIWQGHKMVADKIKHRREALAMMKLIMESEDGNS